MHGVGVNQRWNNDITQDERNKVDAVIRMIGEEIESQARAMGLPTGRVNGVAPSNVVALLDATSLHLAFERTHNPMSACFMLGAPGKTFKLDDAGGVGGSELGMKEPSGFSLPKAILDVPDDEKRKAIKQIVPGYLRQAHAAQNKPRALKGFEALQPLLDAFSDDFPNFDRNVFVAMRFADTAQNKEIWQAIEDTLKRYGMKAHRADSKSYPQDDDLWNNVCVYMMGCKYGICVFDQVDERNFNPNVQIEYGFMRASDKRVLLLKDQRQPTMPVDITGKIRREFDTYTITATVSARVSDWLEKDLGLKPLP